MIPEVAREPVTMQTLTRCVRAGAGLRFCVSNTSLVGSGCWPTDHRASGQAPVSAGQKLCPQGQEQATACAFPCGSRQPRV